MPSRFPPAGRGGIAGADADAESGDSDREADSRRRALFALDALHARGLIDAETYRRRRAAVAAGDAGAAGDD